jgi:hypothetical protein
MALRNKRNVQTHIAANTLIGSREVSRIEAECECGETILIDYDDTICVCGRHYNLSGQELNRNWKEEAIAEGTYYGEDD